MKSKGSIIYAFITSLTIIISLILTLGGCGKNPTGPPPQTALEFILERQGANYEVYLDQNSIGIIRAGAVITKEVSAGSHNYYVKDISTECISGTKLVTIDKGETKQIIIEQLGDLITWEICPKTQLVFKLANLAEEYEIFVDNISKGVLHFNDSISVELTKGQHEYYCVNNKTKCRSEKTRIYLEKGQTIEQKLGHNFIDLNWTECPKTLMQFKVQYPERAFDLFVDENLIGVLDIQNPCGLEVESGTHSYQFFDRETNCTSKQYKYTLSIGDTLVVDISENSFEPDWIDCPSTRISIQMDQDFGEINVYMDDTNMGLLQFGSKIERVTAPGNHKLHFESIASKCISSQSNINLQPYKLNNISVTESMLNWIDCPPTKLILKMKQDWGLTVDVYLDGNNLGTLSYDNSFEKEVNPGEHDIYFIDKVTKCKSKQTSFNMTAYLTTTLNITEDMLSWKECPPTKLTFHLSYNPGAEINIFLDNIYFNKLGYGQTIEKEVVPGAHNVYFVNAVTGCRSSNLSINVPEYSTYDLEIISNMLTWSECPKTQIEFANQESGSTYQVYLDGNMKLILGYGQKGKIEVSPGNHSYYVVNSSCNNVKSSSNSVTVEQYKTISINLNSNKLKFSYLSPTNVGASDGIYENYVKINWYDPNYPKAGKYEIYRTSGSGSYYYLTTVYNNTEYNDYNADRITKCYYKVRAVWPCKKSEWSNSNSGYRKSAKFTDTYVEIDKTNDLIYIHVKFQVDGYKGKSLRLGGYWFRKINGGYYYQSSNCSNSVPGGWLGHLWNNCTIPSCDRCTFSAWFSISYNCFKDRTGTYYGAVKLYKSCSVHDVNDPIIAQSYYVSIYWPSSSSTNNQPQVEILTPEEFKALQHSEADFPIEIIPNTTNNISDMEYGTGNDNDNQIQENVIE